MFIEKIIKKMRLFSCFLWNCFKNVRFFFAQRCDIKKKPPMASLLDRRLP